LTGENDKGAVQRDRAAAVMDNKPGFHQRGKIKSFDQRNLCLRHWPHFGERRWTETSKKGHSLKGSWVKKIMTVLMTHRTEAGKYERSNRLFEERKTEGKSEISENSPYRSRWKVEMVGMVNAEILQKNIHCEKGEGAGTCSWRVKLWGDGGLRLGNEMLCANLRLLFAQEGTGRVSKPSSYPLDRKEKTGSDQTDSGVRRTEQELGVKTEGACTGEEQDIGRGILVRHSQGWIGKWAGRNGSNRSEDKDTTRGDGVILVSPFSGVRKERGREQET